MSRLFCVLVKRCHFPQDALLEITFLSSTVIVLIIPIVLVFSRVTMWVSWENYPADGGPHGAWNWANRIRRANYRVLQLHSHINTAGNKIMTIRGSNLEPQRQPITGTLVITSRHPPIYYKPNRKLSSMVSASFPFTCITRYRSWWHQRWDWSLLVMKNPRLMYGLCYAPPSSRMRFALPCDEGYKKHVWP